MPLARRFLFAVTLGGGAGVQSITSTTFAPLNGALLSVPLLTGLAPKPLVQLAALLKAPAGGAIEAQLAIARGDGSLLQLPGSTIMNADGHFFAAVSQPVLLETFLGQEVLGLRLQARVTTGTGEVALPTLQFSRFA